MNKEIEKLIFEALGEASMCWNPKPSSQVFDSTRAKEIGERLVKSISKASPQSNTVPTDEEIHEMACEYVAQMEPCSSTAQLHALEEFTQGAARMRSRMLTIANEKAKEEAIGVLEFARQWFTSMRGEKHKGWSADSDSPFPTSNSSELYDLYQSSKQQSNKA